MPRACSQYFRGQRDDLHELLVAQLARYGSEDAGADRLELVGQQHRCIAVEANQRAVGTAHTTRGAYHHRVVHLALLHLAARDRVLDAHLDDVADRGIATARATENLDTHQRAGAGVVGSIEHRAQLDHGRALSTLSARRPSARPRAAAMTCAATAVCTGR